MQDVILYRYTRGNGGVMNSIIKPDCSYSIRHRLIADEGKILVNGNQNLACVDVDDTARWSEIDNPEGNSKEF